jgi:hypothetical protein
MRIAFSAGTQMVITDVCLPAASPEMKTAALFGPLGGADAPTEERALLDRILASRHFAKSALLSRFLRYICESHLAGTDSSLTEHHIGVQVFGRSVGYECSDDNIVRNYARQLRNRLDEYFRGEGSEEWLRLQVPRGGYKPIFVRAPRPQPVWIEESQLAEQRGICEIIGAAVGRSSTPCGASPGDVHSGRPASHSLGRRRHAVGSTSASCRGQGVTDAFLLVERVQRRPQHGRRHCR